MKALVTEPPGGWPQTRVADRPDPQPESGEVLIEIRAAALNPADAFLIDGKYPGGPAPPFIAGRDAAGVVLQSNAQETFPAETSVVVLQTASTDLARGTFCERQCVSSENLAPLPEGWSFAEGAAGPLVYQTAWKALTEQRSVQSGQVVAVTGASGGVGMAAVQLARGLGATVVAFSRSEEKRARLRDLGADHVFPPDADDLKAQVFAAIGRKGVDVVVENIGGPSLRTAVHLLGLGGRVAVVGMLAGVEGPLPIPSLLFKRAIIHGVLVTDASPAQSAADWQQIVEVLARTAARPVIDSRFPLDRYREAFDRLGAGPFGKVVLEMLSNTEG